MDWIRIQDLFATKTWQTREEYAKDHNGTCPQYIPQNPQKYWEDQVVDEKGNLKTGKKVGSFAIYEFGLIKDEKGNWTIGPFIVPYEQAIRVNIPPNETAGKDWNPSVYLPPLVRGLADDEEIFEPFPGVPVIRKKTISVGVPVVVSGGFTDEDREVLRTINGKLDKLMKRLGF